MIITVDTICGMAETKESRCKVCGAIVGPGIRFCSHFCKLTFTNDEAAKKKKAKTATIKKVK